MTITSNKTERVNNLRRMIKRIENQKLNPLTLTWKDIQFEYKDECSFWFNGKMYEVDAELIMDKIGRTATAYVCFGGYSAPKYRFEEYEMKITDVDDGILKEWLMGNTNLWSEIKE